MFSIRSCSLSVLVMLFSPAVSANAYPSATSSKQITSMQEQCEAALVEAVRTIETGRDAQVGNITPGDLTERYSDYPADASTTVMFGLQGRAADEVMNSPQFMSNISSKIIEGCPVVGLVEFNMFYSDWTRSYGLVDGQMIEFECVFVDGPYSEDISWGQIGCL